MFVAALDFSRAFDSISHSFLIECLKKFGFPEFFILTITKWLENRNICILSELGQSKFFKSAVGVPQGDALSGFLFILALEIVFIRIRKC